MGEIQETDFLVWPKKFFDLKNMISALLVWAILSLWSWYIVKKIWDYLTDEVIDEILDVFEDSFNIGGSSYTIKIIRNSGLTKWDHESISYSIWRWTWTWITVFILRLMYFLFIHNRDRKLLLEVQRNVSVLKKFLKTSTEAGFIVNKNWEIEFINDSAINLFGYDIDELLWKKVEDFLLPKDEAISDYLWSFMFSEDALRDVYTNPFEMILITKSWEQINILISLSVINLEDKSSWIVVFIRDISNMIKEIEIAKHENMKKSDFLARMSHELRTPLNAIIWFSDVMRYNTFWSLGDSRHYEYVEYIHQSWINLLELINDVLDLSKIESWTMELDIKIFNVWELINMVIGVLKLRIEKSWLTIKFDLVDVVMINADMKRVRQMLFNVLTNSIKFTKQWGCITIKTFINDRNELIIWIEDTGIWMRKEDIDIVMKPYWQIINTDTKNHEWTGLWLPIVKSFMELHWWRFEIYSSPWKWTKCWLVFPSESLRTDWL